MRAICEGEQNALTAQVGGKVQGEKQQKEGKTLHYILVLQSCWAKEEGYGSQVWDTPFLHHSSPQRQRREKCKPDDQMWNIWWIIQNSSIFLMKLQERDRYISIWLIIISAERDEYCKVPVIRKIVHRAESHRWGGCSVLFVHQHPGSTAGRV